MNKLAMIAIATVLAGNTSILSVLGLPGDGARDVAVALLVAMFLQPWVIEHLE